MKAVEELNALKEEYFVSDLNRVKPRHTLDLNSGVKINKAESVDTISEIQEELRQQVARQHENAVNPVSVPVMEPSVGDLQEPGISIGDINLNPPQTALHTDGYPFWLGL